LVWTAAGGGESLPKALVFGLVALGFTVALIRRSRWALRALAAVFVLTAIILPVGIWNPFTAGDYMAGGREPRRSAEPWSGSFRWKLGCSRWPLSSTLQTRNAPHERPPNRRLQTALARRG